MKKTKPFTKKILSKELKEIIIRHHNNTITDGLNAEFKYCKTKIESGSSLEHWKIRVAEIEKQLKRKKK